MEFLHLIKASSMVRSALGEMPHRENAEKEMEKSIEKLKADLARFDKLEIDGQY
ncbi:MAG: hypothetical protein M0R40_07370 [Firmicutes bacterium]|nr:hypothetical protein [Bacillota bacterium]